MGDASAPTWGIRRDSRLHVCRQRHQGDASVPTHHPNSPIDSNKIEKGVAKSTTKKENPFTRALYTRKEFLVMTHDSVSESKRQLPAPSEQQLVKYVTQQSLALVSSATRRGRPATLTT